MKHKKELTEEQQKMIKQLVEFLIDENALIPSEVFDLLFCE